LLSTYSRIPAESASVSSKMLLAKDFCVDWRVSEEVKESEER
jgi:hypothetical protein